MALRRIGIMGAQVIPPHDKGIVREVEKADVIPTVDFALAVADGSIQIVGSDIDNDYVAEVVKLSESPARSISAVYTPLHGVGETNVYAVITAAGFQNVSIFEPHRTADGNFRTCQIISRTQRTLKSSVPS